MKRKIMTKLVCILLAGLMIVVTFAIPVSATPAPHIYGPTHGRVNVRYDFTINCYDPDDPDFEEPVIYYIDWGDTFMVVRAPTRENITVSHSWTEIGTFTISAWADSPDNNVTHEIQIDRLTLSVSGGMGVTASITNDGEFSKGDVEWSIEVIGGTFPGFHINRFYNNSIDLLKPGETAIVGTGTFFGLGKLKITVTAECAGEPKYTKTIDGLILFFYVMIM